jgi:hypothetical protein
MVNVLFDKARSIQNVPRGGTDERCYNRPFPPANLIPLGGRYQMAWNIQKGIAVFVEIKFVVTNETRAIAFFQSHYRQRSQRRFDNHAGRPGEIGRETRRATVELDQPLDSR